jgi:glycosyltransferase involved in cell wall biosynthesis
MTKTPSTSSAEGPDGAPPVEVSIVMPCLNEADTLAGCIGKALDGLGRGGIRGEIIVSDNGSTDGSPEIARSLGARVVAVRSRGYGNALMGGIAAARAPFIVMGDSDDSYDFREVPRFVAKFREGYELVQGCRLPSGGGTVRPGAMPPMHRWLGNPLFSLLARRWFRAPVHDVYCGLRGFTRALYDRLDQRCTGMEFATEMILKASLFRAAIAEVPVTLHPDGRKSHPRHLRTFRDGWRTLRFFLMMSPRWLFLWPGLFLILAGLFGYALALPQVRISGVEFSAHTLLFASLSIICGYQAILFGALTKVFAVREGLLPEDERLSRLFRVVRLEQGLLVGAASMLVGIAFLVVSINEWRIRNFGNLDYARTMKWVIPGVTLTALGFQTVLWSFFMSILGMRRR